MTDIFTKFDRFSPALCRLLARHKHGAALTTPEICVASGLNTMFVTQLSWQMNWEFVDVYFLRKFSLACGVDFASSKQMQMHHDFLEGPACGGIPPQFAHLKRSPDWNPFFKPLMQAWMRSLPHSPQYASYWKPMMERWHSGRV